jgi:flagellar hook-length control protein FliK
MAMQAEAGRAEANAAPASAGRSGEPQAATPVSTGENATAAARSPEPAAAAPSRMNADRREASTPTTAPGMAGETGVSASRTSSATRGHPLSTYAAQLADQSPSPERTAPVGGKIGSPTDVAPAGAPGRRAQAEIVEPLALATMIAATDAPVSEPAARADLAPVASAALGSRPATEAVAMAHPRVVVHPATTQVAVAVARAVEDGVDRISIKLQPPELGRIDVRLDLGTDGRVQAVILAERPATLEILQRDARDLERALNNAGLDAGNGGLSFGLRSNNGNGQGGGHGPAGHDRRAMPETQPGDTPPAPFQRPNRAAGDGRLDIHV